MVGGLIGLGEGGEEGMEVGATAGAEAASGGVDVFDEEEAWDVLEELPNDAAAALILLEHRWAIALRDAMVRAGGFPIAGSFISPLDLVEVGLHRRAKRPRRSPPPTRGDRPKIEGGTSHDASTQGRQAHVSTHVETDGRSASAAAGRTAAHRLRGRSRRTTWPRSSSSPR